MDADKARVRYFVLRFFIADFGGALILLLSGNILLGLRYFIDLFQEFMHIMVSRRAKKNKEKRGIEEGADLELSETGESDISGAQQGSLVATDSNIVGETPRPGNAEVSSLPTFRVVCTTLQEGAGLETSEGGESGISGTQQGSLVATDSSIDNANTTPSHNNRNTASNPEHHHTTNK
jgi:hypothetical protein